MRLSKTGYYADFVIYATVLATATVVTAWRNTAYETSIWLLAAAIGALIWTLAEYILHRFVLHQMRPFAAMHDAHHEAPLAFVGTPTWLSLGVILGSYFCPHGPWAHSTRRAAWRSARWPDSSGTASCTMPFTIANPGPSPFAC